MKTSTRVLLLSVTWVLVYACGDHDENVGPEGAIYQGKATDEALVVLLAATPKAGPPLMMTAPTSAQMVPAATPMTFTWTGGLAIAVPPPSRSPGNHGGTRRASVAGSLPGGFGVRAAFAHDIPMNGPGYYLRVIAQDNSEILRLFTSAKSYTPDAATWQRLSSAGGELRATLLSGFFEKNNLTADGGPIEAAPVTFQITP